MAAAPGDLATVANVKAWLGGSTDSTNDTVLQTLVTAASAWLVNYLSRNILSASYIETRRGTGNDSIVMRNYPITAVASVKWGGTSITVQADPIALSMGYLFDGRRIDLIGYCLPYRDPVVISYTAGYAAVPSDIGQAVCELVGEAFKRRERIGQASKSLGNGEVVSFMMKDMSEPTRSMLANYRNTVPV